MKPLSAALVLETNNLRGGAAEEERVVATLERLFLHLREQTLPLAQLQQIIVTHDGIGAASQARLEHAAGAPLCFVKIPPDCSYYDAKNIGFDRAEADVVAFGDADCWPEADWLERLLAPFEHAPETEVVAGRTTYRRDWLGVAASTVDFMYFDSPLGHGCTRNFYANNVAFRRDVYARHRYTEADAIYRGHCQVLGLKLQAQGVRVVFEPRARTIHRFPDSLKEMLKLRILRGEDTYELTPYLTAAYLPAKLQWFARTGPIAPLVILAIRLAYSVRAIGRQDMPRVLGLRYLACLAAILGISAADAVGAFMRGSRLPGFTRRARAASALALSYHVNRDGLS